MARNYKILGEQQCPRCNAKAKMKAVWDHPDSNAIAIVIACPKCKLHLITGFTNRKQMNRIERHSKLLKKYKEAKTPLERGKLMREVQRMASEEEDWIEGIANS